MAKDEDIRALKERIEQLEKGGGSGDGGAAIRALVAELRDGATPDRAVLSAEKQRELSMPHAKPQRWRVIACKSQRTGGLFDAHIVESRDPNMPHGRIVAIGPYRMPLGRYTYQSAGGIVPDGFPILDKSRGAPNVPDETEIPNDQLHMLYKAWRTKEFFVLDLREYVGKAMTPAICRREGGIETEWNEGAPRDQAAE